MATFDHIVRYEVRATCVSPFRTGADAMLRDDDGRYYVQATSIAGALRSWIARQDATAADRLFGRSLGDDGTGSLVCVSDGWFVPGVETQDRPRLRMDRDTGSGADGGKYSVNCIVPGVAFTFRLELKTCGADPDGEAWLVRALSALDAGEITLGAQNSNGFGRVTLEISGCSYDMRSAADRTAWLNRAPGQPIPVELTGQAHPAVLFVLTGTADEVLVRSGIPDKRPGIDGRVALPMTDGRPEHYILPGSSVKGCLRGRAEMIAAYKGRPELPEHLFGRTGQVGDTGHAGLIRVEECRLDQVKTAVISRTRINRFTGGVMNSSLFSEQPVSGRVTLRVEQTRPDGACSALLFFALRDLALGRYALGSGTGVGRGRLTDGALTVTAGDRSCAVTCENGTQQFSGDTSLLRAWIHDLEGEGASE